MVLVVIAILEYRTKQSAFRGSPSHSGHVCAGSIALDEAQREIETDWYRVYVTIRPVAGGRSATRLEY
jgi:hypothetical protein